MGRAAGCGAGARCWVCAGAVASVRPAGAPLSRWISAGANGFLGEGALINKRSVSPESFPARERGGGDGRGAAVGSRALGSRVRDFRPVEVLGCGVGFGRWGWLVSWRRSSSRTNAASPQKSVSRRLSTKGRLPWAHTASEASGTARWARLESGWVCATWGSSRGVSGVDRRRQT